MLDSSANTIDSLAASYRQHDQNLESSSHHLKFNNSKLNIKMIQIENQLKRRKMRKLHESFMNEEHINKKGVLPFIKILHCILQLKKSKLVYSWRFGASSICIQFYCVLDLKGIQSFHITYVFLKFETYHNIFL